MDYDIQYAKKALLVLAPLAVVVLYTESMLIPSLIKIEQQFGVNASQASWVLSIYLLSGVVANPIIGKLGDIYGKKRILTMVIWLYAVAVTLTGFSPNFTALVVFRAIQGMGLGMFPLAFSLVREEFPPNMIAKAQGTLSAMFGVGSAIGLPIGAYISQTYGWEYTYHSVIPFVILLAVLTNREIRESRFKSPDAKIDVVGSLLLGTSLGLVILGITEGPTWGWSSLPVELIFVISLVVLALFVKAETLVPYPLMSLKLLSRRNVVVSNSAAFVAGFALFMSYQSLTYLFELPHPVGYGLDILSTGLTLFPLGIIQLITGPFAGSRISRSGPKPWILIGSSLTGVAFILEAILSLSGDKIPILFFMLAASLSMMGATMLNVSLINLLVFSLEPKVMGVGSAMNTVFRLVGGSMGPAVAGSVLTTFTTTELFPIPTGGGVTLIPEVLPSDFAFTAVFTISSVIVVVLFLLGTEAKNVIPGKSIPLKKEETQMVPE